MIQQPHGRVTLARRLTLQVLVALLASLAMTAVAAISSQPAAARSMSSSQSSSTHAALAQKALAASSSGQVTIIVLDMSGSMGQGQHPSDPQGLRCSIADAYISLSGPNQFVGVVGLADPTGTGNAQIWAKPTEMATLPERQQLIQTITNKSDNCAANGWTPTYDALSKAYAMLTENVTQGRTGSVILLTDGAPEPNQSQQTKDILNQLIPKFKQAGYPIDTVALGYDPSVRPFLKEVSAGTDGYYDDDVNPSTNQPDPLQIARVFLRYFQALTGRTPKTLVPQQQLNGSVTQRDFLVSSLVQHLDVVVIKQDANAQVSLVSPEGIVYTQSRASVLVALDPHYAIFSIDGPTSGDWTVRIAGGSQEFAAYGLVSIDLHIAITQPASSVKVFPIDQAVALQATLSNSQGFVNADYTVTGQLIYGSQVIETVVLNHVPGSARYTGSVSLPSGQPAGSYTLTLSVKQGSGDVLVSIPRVIDFAIFPVPFLLNSSGAPETGVSVTGVAFDGLLQRIYSLPVVSWFSGLPLNGIPATPSAIVNGEVMYQGKVYTNATVQGYATQAGQKGRATASVVPTGSGHFNGVFPAATSGQYTLWLSTTGTFRESAGFFGPSAQRQVNLTIRNATWAEEGRAWGFTAVYLLILLFLSPLIYRWFLARRQGSWTMSGLRGGSGRERGGFYNNAVFGENMRWWFRPNTVTSNKVWGFPGLLFTWTHAGARVTRTGRDADLWKVPQNGSIGGKYTYTLGKGNPVTFDVSTTQRSGQDGTNGGHDNRGRSGFDRGRASGNARGFGQSGARSSSPAPSSSAGGRRGFGRDNTTNSRATNNSSSRTSSRGFGQPR